MAEENLSDGAQRGDERGRAEDTKGSQRAENVLMPPTSEASDLGNLPAADKAAMMRPVRVPKGNQRQAGHDPRFPIASEPAEPSGLSRWASGDRLVGIADIRAFFKIGRTAAYELTHRPGFPDPVPISARRYRWWASEVEAFAIALRHERARRDTRPRMPDPTVPPGRITGTVRAARARREPS